jgi:hypothetical protein
MKSSVRQLKKIPSTCPDCGKYPILRKVADPFEEEEYYWSYGCDCTMAVSVDKKAVYESYGYPKNDSTISAHSSLS